jgi:hypothetical protein
LIGPSSSPTRIIILPRFSETGIIALIDIASPTLECKTVNFGIPEWEKVKVKISEKELEAEVERLRTQVVKSDLDLLMDEDGW